MVPGTPPAHAACDAPQQGGSSESIDAPDLEVAAFQELLLFSGSESESVSCWTDPDDGATGNPARVTAAIEQAPASFNAPCQTKRECFRPPFVVNVTATQTRPTTLGCRASCYMLTDQQLENVKSWRPDVHGAEDLLDGKEVEGQACGTAVEGGYEASIRLVFSSLRCVKPSGMSKRYPLFMLQLSSGITLLLVYRKPTVVLSRLADQYNKALLILKDVQPVDGRSLRGKEGAAASAAAAREAAVQRLKKRDALHEGDDESDSKYYNASVATDYIVAQFNDAGIKRQLSDSDLTLLLEMAGYTQYNLPADPTNPEQASVMKRQTISEHQWEFFTGWFERKFMPAIKAAQSLWDQRSPNAICPLSTTRAMCESALKNSPLGAFCVRARRLKVGDPVNWVISCCGKKPGAPVLHILLMSKHLDMHSLQVWVRDFKQLMYCMDISTGRLCHKEQLFLNGYNRIENRDYRIENCESYNPWCISCASPPGCASPDVTKSIPVDLPYPM